MPSGSTWIILVGNFVEAMSKHLTRALLTPRLKAKLASALVWFWLMPVELIPAKMASVPGPPGRAQKQFFCLVEGDAHAEKSSDWALIRCPYADCGLTCNVEVDG